MISIPKLQSLKTKGEKFACITAYDASFARLASDAGIEVILVGDSLGNVVQGRSTTIPVTVDEIAYHLRCVCAGQPSNLIMADLPFMSYATTEQALTNATKLMQAGAQCVKLEGGAWLADTIRQLTERGIPVAAHLGLTPQSVHALGGYKVQGKTAENATQLQQDAFKLEQAGASFLVLECIPSALAADISGQLTIPTIGIGAGGATDAQILVLHDLLGISSNYLPKFSKNFLLETTGNIKEALEHYHHAVIEGRFPEAKHCF